MENQELPKKLTPEEIEQQKKNLEQKDEKTEQPIEKDNSALLSDLNEKIEKKTQIVEDTKNKIDEIRNGLGLPPSNEIPPSVQTEQEAIVKLNQEKESLNYSLIAKNTELIENEMKTLADKTIVDGKKTFKFTSKEDEDKYKKLQKLLLSPSSELNKELDILNKDTKKEYVVSQSQESEKTEETKKFERNLQTVLEDISTQSKTMFDALYERQQERLTPLQSNDNFQMMVSNIRNLKNFEGKIDINSISKITEDINKLSRLFDDIKVQPVGGQMRENSQNLEKLGFGAKKFSSSLEDNKHKIPIEMSDKVMEEKSRELRKSIQRLSEQIQKMWLFANKLRENSR